MTGVTTSSNTSIERKSIAQWIIVTFIVVCCFPNLNLFGFDNLGVQPNALFIGVALLPMTRWQFSKVELEMLGVATILILTGVIIGSLRGLDMGAIRSMGNVASFSIVFLLGRRALFCNREAVFASLKTALWIYVGVALIQITIAPAFGQGLLPHQSGSFLRGRGVTSLATEPTYFGYYLICLAVLFWTLDMKRKVMYSIVALLSLLFASRSTTSIAVLGAIAACFALIKAISSARGFVVVTVLLAATYHLYEAVGLELGRYLLETQSSRALTIFGKILNDPTDLLTLDGSGNRRFLAIALSVYGAFDVWLVPQGFNSFNEYINSKEIQDTFSELIVYLADYNRIQSTIGGLLWEYGAMGLILVVFILRKLSKSGTDVAIVAGIAIFFIMLNPVPLGNPLLALTICLSINRDS